MIKFRGLGQCLCQFPAKYLQVFVVFLQDIPCVWVSRKVFRGYSPPIFKVLIIIRFYRGIIIIRYPRFSFQECSSPQQLLIYSTYYMSNSFFQQLVQHQEVLNIPYEVVQQAQDIFLPFSPTFIHAQVISTILHSDQIQPISFLQQFLVQPVGFLQQFLELGSLSFSIYYLLNLKLIQIQYIGFFT